MKTVHGVCGMYFTIRQLIELQADSGVVYLRSTILIMVIYLGKRYSASVGGSES